ncbi:AraC family transcriptional regulator [soil metagenome]
MRNSSTIPARPLPGGFLTIARGALLKMLVALHELGVDAEAVRLEAGLPADVMNDASLPADVVNDAGGRIPIASLHAAWAAAGRRLCRSDAALLVARHYVPGDYGLVGFVAMNGATLADALAQIVRFGSLWTDDPVFALGEDGTLDCRCRTSSPCGPGVRYAHEAGLAELLSAARLVTQTRLSPREVHFAHPGPADPSAHEAFFGCPVRFDARETALLFLRETLALPLPKADAQLGAFLTEMATDALGRRTRESSPPERIKEIIGEELRRCLPPLEQIARRLATSERTLRRRLEEEGTSFRTLLDETRAELAQSYVRDGKLSLSEVAFLVGFSETSAFNRAFKRWTGSPPSAWRSEQGARSA